MNCACCSAPLPGESVVCSYCGSRQDVDLRGWARAESSGPSENLRCPQGHGPLERLRLSQEGAPPLHRCATCLGLFLGRGVVDQLLHQAVGTVWEENIPLLTTQAENPRHPGGSFRYRPCPRCGEMMNRQLFGTRSGVIVDRCRDHGTWLDAGERRRQEQESIERRRREAIEASGRGWEEEDGLRFLARALRRLLR